MEDNMLELVGDDGEKYRLEILDLINKDGVDYLVTLPEDSEDEVVILEVQPDEDSDNASYIEVTDDDLADEIFNEYLSKMDEEETDENE